MKSPRRSRSALLLDHCARASRLTEEGRPSARRRLVAELGDDLTRTLLSALCAVPERRRVQTR